MKGVQFGYLKGSEVYKYLEYNILLSLVRVQEGEQKKKRAAL
ncbi:hypothetical protein [Flagellimonas algicola]|nr:hypothetical protein [Allomuricauda algicola]